MTSSCNSSHVFEGIAVCFYCFWNPGVLVIRHGILFLVLAVHSWHPPSFPRQKPAGWRWEQNGLRKPDHRHPVKISNELHELHRG